MSQPLSFMMGKFEAEIPTDRFYAKNHMWAQPAGDAEDAWRFGFSAYAVRLLQDVYFLEWHVEPGMRLAARQTIGAIESSKAESDLFAPVGGKLIELNPELLRDPSAINVDKYSAGWLFALVPDMAAQEATDRIADGRLLSPQQYLIHLDAAWKLAERTIKGQIN